MIATLLLKAGAYLHCLHGGGGMSQSVEVYDHDFLHLYMRFVASCSCMLPDDELPISLLYADPTYLCPSLKGPCIEL